MVSKMKTKKNQIVAMILIKNIYFFRGKRIIQEGRKR